MEAPAVVSALPLGGRKPDKAKSQLDHAFPYRMKDLCELTGLERQAIHFYIQEGLVPEGRKTGRNMAFYGEAHLERIRLIKKLQKEQFLPLRAIAAVLNGSENDFAPEQRALLLEVKSKLRGNVIVSTKTETVSVGPLLAEHGLEERDFEEMVQAGLIAVSEGRARSLRSARIQAADAWQLELFGELRRAGFTRELGFGARDFSLYVDAIEKLFAEEKKILMARLGHLPPDTIASVVDRSLPIIGAMLERYHTTTARHFFAALGETPAKRTRRASI